MDKLIDEILAIYKRIDKGEICEEDEARKELRKAVEAFTWKLKMETLKSVNRLLDTFREHMEWKE